MSNLYKAFAELFAQDPLWVGEVVATNSLGSTVELPDGSRINVRGTATVGSKVFVRAGVIEGPAPDVATVHVIDV